MLNFVEIRDNEKKIQHFFLNLKSKVYPQDFSTNELEDDFLSDLATFKYFLIF